MDWHEIDITKDTGPSPNDLRYTYYMAAKEIWEKAGCPEGFRVYQKIASTFDLFLYFNLDAQRYCAATGLLSLGRVQPTGRSRRARYSLSATA
jgi:hypothetical protein